MGKLRFGVHRPLEDEADRLIKQSLMGVTKHSSKSDILTPWKQDDRRRREVYTANGTPDRSVREGMFNRAWNPRQPHLNSRDGLSRHSGQGARGETSDRHIGGTLADFLNSQFDQPESD